ncbi:MAG: YebC/PmpR family DNA-binding transcriptional regulator [Deltaproteobacteria bacterium]|nr:YebC/PmpR family DNA-binding transcriptional regulator [Deltaproteobacteria bacterium]
MSGHSKWSTIKHKKGKADAARGKVFTKLIKEITVAARMGGGDIDGNSRLRKAVTDARSSNMPSDTITRAIKKGTGELEGVNYEELVYAGTAPGGVFVLMEVMTDNKNRTVGEIRNIIERLNGALTDQSAVAWAFDKKGVIVCAREIASEDDVMEYALDNGADDVVAGEKEFEVYCDPKAFDGLKAAFDRKGWATIVAEVTMKPQNPVKLTGKPAESILKLLEELDDHDDVQHVYSNADIDPALMA